MKSAPDPTLRERMEAQCDRIAELIEVDPELVMYDTSTRNICLTPDQADRLLSLIVRPVQTTDKCTCRCNKGQHCGGCGHEGCGYDQSVFDWNTLSCGCPVQLVKDTGHHQEGCNQ